jgi:hypothetical protein
LSDGDLDQMEIRELYGRIDRKSCAVKEGMLPALNSDCAVVREDTCASLLEIAGAFLERRLPAGAIHMKEMAGSRYGCPMERFAQLFRK